MRSAFRALLDLPGQPLGFLAFFFPRLISIRGLAFFLFVWLVIRDGFGRLGVLLFYARRRDLAGVSRGLENKALSGLASAFPAALQERPHARRHRQYAVRGFRFSKRVE